MDLKNDLNQCFGIVNEDEKDYMMAHRKAENTNKATKQWVLCLNDYLKEKQLPNIDDITTEDLPSVLGDFYFSARKKRISEDGTTPSPDKIRLTYYKNSSLKSGRAALNRYFKGTRGIDIISSEKFIKSNQMFQAVTKKGKKEGRGETESKQPISDEDMSTLSTYFINSMRGPPNAKNLQEVVLFNVIYYGACCGRENLRSMTKATFEIKTDHDGRKYLYQKLKEADKNHTEEDYGPNNEARIYELKGN